MTLTLMDGVQIALLLLLLLLLCRPFWAGWLPRRWLGLTRRWLPPRALKYEGTWKRHASPTDNAKK